MIDKQGHLVPATLVERKTKFNVAIKAPNKTAQVITDEFCNNLKTYQNRIFILNYENGREFSYYEQISHDLKTGGLSALPYHSWGKYLNEKSSGMIPQCIQKSKGIKNLND
jgi:IS30 family transposase